MFSPFRLFATCALAILCAAAPLRAQRKPFTVEAATANRQTEEPSGPVWSPDGKRIAYWLGKRVMVYDVASRQRREVADTARLPQEALSPAEPERFAWQNRRVSEQRLQWFPDSEAVLVLAQGDLFRVPLKGKTAPLTHTQDQEFDPKLSPDGKQVSFVRGNDLYALQIAEQRTHRLTRDGSATLQNARPDWVYPEELDLGTAHWWSPDSQRIAFLQFDVSRELAYPHADLLRPYGTAEPQRYPHAGTPNADVRVGVVAGSGGPVRWLDLGDTRDALLARVQWTLDSQQIAVQRLNRVQNQLRLLLANIDTGVAKLLWEEKDPAWVNVSDDLNFLPDGRFVWSSERTGYRHLYLHSAAGDVIRPLTSGEWEVTSVVALDKSKGQVYFLSSEVSPLERQLYRVPLEGGARQRITEEAGTHSVQLSVAGQRYLDSFSSLQQPPQTVLRSFTGASTETWVAADRTLLEQYALQPREFVTFAGPDNLRFQGQLTKPVGFTSGKTYPAVVIVYGGPGAQTVRNAWAQPGLGQVLAQRGYVVWSMDNRGAAGHGHKWESALYRRFGKTELEDQLAGVRHLLSLGFVDPQRVGIYGWSYGGYMTLYSLFNAPQVFRAGIAGAAVTNWRLYDTIYTERYLGLPQDNEQGYRDSSPVFQAAKLQGKLLLVHNFEDDNVLFQNALQMMNALQEAGKPFETMMYPQKAHAVTGAARKHMWQGMLDFFDRTLGTTPSERAAR